MLMKPIDLREALPLSQTSISHLFFYFFLLSQKVSVTSTATRLLQRLEMVNKLGHKTSKFLISCAYIQYSYACHMITNIRI